MTALLGMALAMCVLSVLTGCSGISSRSGLASGSASMLLCQSAGELSVAHVPHDSSKVLIWEFISPVGNGDAFATGPRPTGELRLLRFDLERGGHSMLWHGSAPFCPTQLDTDVHADLLVVHVGNDVELQSGPRSAVFEWDASAPQKPYVELSGWRNGLGAGPQWRPQGDAVCYMFKAWGESGFEGRSQLMLVAAPRSPRLAAGPVVSRRDVDVIDFAWSADGRRLYASCSSKTEHSLDIIHYPTLETESFILPGEATDLSVAQDTGDVVFVIRGSSESGAGGRSGTTGIWRLTPGGRPEQVMSVAYITVAQDSGDVVFLSEEHTADQINSPPSQDVTIWQMSRSGELTRTPVKLAEGPYHAVVSPQGDRLAVVPEAGTERRRSESGIPSFQSGGLLVYSLNDGKARRIPGFEGRVIDQVAWVDEGRGIVLVEGGQRLWLVPLPESPGSANRRP